MGLEANKVTSILTSTYHKLFLVLLWKKGEQKNKQEKNLKKNFSQIVDRRECEPVSLILIINTYDATYMIFLSFEEVSSMMIIVEVSTMFKDYTKHGIWCHMVFIVTVVSF